jgi:hypothetical protein
MRDGYLSLPDVGFISHLIMGNASARCPGVVGCELLPANLFEAAVLGPGSKQQDDRGDESRDTAFRWEEWRVSGAGAHG